MSEVAGVKLADLVEPIHDALVEHQAVSNGRLTFDAVAAGQLLLTPEKPNSARSQTEVLMPSGNKVGDLYVIAFAPGDGTGDTNTYGMDDIDFGDYPREARYIPRSKESVRSEVFLPLLGPDAEGALGFYYGGLDLLGLDKGQPKPTIVKLAELGDVDAANVGRPQAVFTCGQRLKTWRNTFGMSGGYEERFGDPHAVVNSLPDSLLVGAFLAVTSAVSSRSISQHAALESLQPIEPNWVV